MLRENRIAMQGQVLFALIMREMATRYGRNAGGYIWAVLEPLSILVLLSLLFEMVARRPALGSSFPIFFATGYIAYHFYMDISRAVSAAVNSNRPLLSFPRVTILDTIIARLILQFITLVFVSTILFSVFLSIYEDQIIINPRYIFYSVSLASFVGVSIGILNCVMFAWSPVWQTVFGIVNRPLFLISGVLFIYEDMPRTLQNILWWNPFIHITAIMRQGFYPIYDPVWTSVLYVFIFGAVPLVIGLLLLRTLRMTLLEQ